MLDSIGYRASLVMRSDYLPGVYNHTIHPDVEVSNWYPDFPAMSQYYLPLLGCTGENTLTAITACNPAIDHAAHAALTTQLTDPGTAQRQWQAIYTAVDKDARLIANSTVLNNAVLRSARVHNIHFSLFQGALLDQIWIKA